jgi:hypothetical protein
MTWQARPPFFRTLVHQRRCGGCEDVLVDVYCRQRHRTLADRGTVGEGCDAWKGKGSLSAQNRGCSCGRRGRRCCGDRNLRDCRSEKAEKGAAIRSDYMTAARTRRVASREGRDD